MILFLSWYTSSVCIAEIGNEDFTVAEILKITESEISREIEAEILSTKQVIQIEQSDGFVFTEKQQPRIGENVVLGKFEMPNGIEWQIYDKYRFPALIVIIALLFMVAIGIGGWRGASSLIGLAASISIIIWGIIPAIVAGHSPLAVCLIGGVVIAGVTIFLAHGFSKNSALAFVVMLISLFFAAGLATVFAEYAQLFGAGSEEAFYLTNEVFGNINLRGLLLGGILIGALGVLDDVTVAQVTVIAELKKANPRLAFRELFYRGLKVGREHIASMINTLALAYVGVSLPLVLLFMIDGSQPWWVVLNSEFIAEEIIRTVVGSIALIFAVPIASGIGAYFLGKK